MREIQKIIDKLNEIPDPHDVQIAGTTYTITDLISDLQEVDEGHALDTQYIRLSGTLEALFILKNKAEKIEAEDSVTAKWIAKIISDLAQEVLNTCKPKQA